MPRFVLLRHDCPADYRDGPHWDLMLERAGVRHTHRLATWALLDLPTSWMVALSREGPSSEPPIDAERLPDHRAVYLQQEGPIGGGRGTVERWAEGVATWIEDAGAVVVARLAFDGAPLVGEVSLREEPSGRWRLEWVSAK